ncbi:MAG: methylmalonyl-CoA mutase family protein [Bacteroidales bacterium]|jgi:methylmalonyl-CoA mutase|nr:methylmalonyl-CoA mutase family protein [Bacteroidales bacterium]
MNNEKLFQQFPEVSTQEWEAVIMKDLKGADYNKKLVWHTDEGFDVRPYYRAEDLLNISYLDSLPNEFPYTRGYKTEGNNWEIVQEITEKDPTKANEMALKAITKGANLIAFNSADITTADQLELLLQNIDLEKNGVQFNHSKSYVPLVKLFVDYINRNGYNKEQIIGAINFDAIVFALKQGKFYHSKAQDLDQLIELINITKELKKFRVINVNGLALHNAGATIVQELGYSLGIASEYIAYLTEKGIPIHNIARKMQFTLSVGTNYFMEIAKIRAIRLLWSTIVNQYNPECECAYELKVNTVASSWNKTLYDPYVNILRSTTEGMAAAIGGADSIALKPFDMVYKQEDEFSARINRNIQIILKEESYFDKVVDPSAGSYYIENLTNSIAEHSWKLFQHVEKEGGMLKLVENGEVKADILTSCNKRNMDIATRKYILLGTNQYPNVNEMMLDKMERSCDSDSSGLQSYRGAKAFEDLRLETERFAQKSHRPVVFLLKIGNLAMRQARAGFITNFFGCAGYEIIDNAGFNTVEEGINAAFDAHADVIVMCSSDEEYASLGVEAAKITKEKSDKVLFVIAGNPTECIETLKSAGTDDFIHVKVNVLETLKRYNELLLN